MRVGLRLSGERTLLCPRRDFAPQGESARWARRRGIGRLERAQFGENCWHRRRLRGLRPHCLPGLQVQDLGAQDSPSSSQANFEWRVEPHFPNGKTYFPKVDCGVVRCQSPVCCNYLSIEHKILKASLDFGCLHLSGCTSFAAFRYSFSRSSDAGIPRPSATTFHC